ncbi:N-acetyltransferase [Nostocoides veronense]|uniref:N-acetyltransferase n=1 Tax=Nostocoides veronense TaxID=330836 RepID=A0ABN2M2M6_9MICO
MDIHVRAESPEDILAVRRVHAESFATPPGAAEPIEAPLLDRLRADGAVLSALTFVAVRDGEVVGSVVCSRGRIGERPSVGLGPIAVLPSHQRQGIGSALMAAVIDAAQVAGEREIALLGDPAYYARFGFLPAAQLGIQSPGPWGEYFQARPLTHLDPSRDGGPFRYASAFDSLEDTADEH